MSMVAIKYQDASTGSIVESASQKITSGAAHVADQAVHPGEDSTLDRTWGGPVCSYAMSISTGTIKATAGVLYGLMVTTGGTLALKDGTNQLLTKVSATVSEFLVIVPGGVGVRCTTNISLSASSAVVTAFYV